MRYLKILLLCGVWLLTGCRDHVVYGNHHLQTEVRRLPSIQRVTAKGDFDIRIVHSSQQKVMLTAESNVLPLVVTQVKNGRLIVQLKSDVNISTHHPIQVTLQLRSIEEVVSRGSSHFDLSELQEPQLNVFLEGAGDMHLSGQVNEASYQIVGTGKIDAQHLQENDVEANLSGAGQLRVSVKHHLQVAITGVSKVRYTGHPVVHTTAGPFATVTRQG